MDTPGGSNGTSPNTSTPATPISSVDSSSSPTPAPTITIPSTGITYWEHRRACFLANVPFPAPRTPATALPQTYDVAPAPEPVIARPYTPASASSIARLEGLLEFENGDVAWNGGVGGVHRNLTGGRMLAKGLRLGLVIKVLRAGWARDGTWPVDAQGRPVDAPDSPPLPPIVPDDEVVAKCIG